MDIFKHDMYRGPNIGIYAAACDECVFLPRGFARAKAERISGLLGARPVLASVAGTRVLGTMMVAAGRTALLPATAMAPEAELIEAAGMEVAVIGSRYTALGNLVCANARGAIVSPEVPRADAAAIGEALGVEAVQTRIAGYHQVGAMLAANSSGGVIHPEASDEEVSLVSGVLHARIELATVNGGVPFVSSGLLVNNRAAVAGSFTSGPEIMMLTRAFLN